MAELKQKPAEEKPETKDPLALDMSKKTCNKAITEKLKNSKILSQKPRKVEKGVILETICDSNDIESRISITKITNKLSSTDLSDVKISVKSFSPDEVKELQFDAIGRDVEM